MAEQEVVREKLMAVETQGILISALLALIIYSLRRKLDKGTLRRTLFSELSHIREHYLSSIHLAKIEELSADKQQRELRLMLKWSKFGELDTVDYIDRYAILGCKQIDYCCNWALASVTTTSSRGKLG